MKTQRLTNKKPYKKGFTLIELMIVISIILVLVSFLVPKFIAYKDKAKDTKAINTAKQIQVAAINSYNENEDTFNPDKVRETIETFTGIKAENATCAGNTVKVEYKSDNEDYSVDIDLDSNNYTVNKKGKAIFPKK